jgi:hypothetical protein
MRALVYLTLNAGSEGVCGCYKHVVALLSTGSTDNKQAYNSLILMRIYPVRELLSSDTDNKFKGFRERVLKNLG